MPVGLDPARSKSLQGMAGPGDCPRWEMGRGHCLISEVSPPVTLETHQEDHSCSGKEGQGECIKRSKDLIKIPQHILNLLSFVLFLTYFQQLCSPLKHLLLFIALMILTQAVDCLL